ncbi:MAG: hypothetical protein Q4B85_13760 [Lachnospiraceae bacterium]|nr:hypothetical protein [Lachnospiraceae bacterium]
MTKRILFSPIGGTDPISNCRDGAMLHICRKYLPDVVVLYMSKEVVEWHRKDDRYCYCLHQLEEKTGHRFQEIRVVERPELRDVHVFDAFLTEYLSILNQIHKELPEAEILVNVSSGTPAMKNALHFLAAISEYPILPIQVSTPEKKINPHLENHDDYDPALYWECNEDNEEGFEDRCTESKSQNLMDQIKRKNIARYVESYDYVAALQMAETLVNPLPDSVMAMLRGANCRMKLDINGMTRELGVAKNEILPIRHDKYRNIFEHLLNLDIKLRKEEYVDFLRGVTPVIVDLFELALEKYCGIRLDDYRLPAPKSGFWDEGKTKANPVIMEAFTKKFGLDFRFGPIGSVHLLAIMNHVVKDEKLLKLSNSLRTIETDVRNIAAHEIVSVTEQWVVSHTTEHLSLQQINQMLQEYAMLMDMGIRKEYWNSYDDMNRSICRRIAED